jgi:hypothetical protein
MTVNALILMGVVYGLTEMAKGVAPDNLENQQWFKVLAALVISFAAVFLVAETDWAKDQFLGEKSLDTLSWASKIVAAIFIAGGAALTQRVVKAASDFGQNHEEKYTPSDLQRYSNVEPQDAFHKEPTVVDPATAKALGGEQGVVDMTLLYVIAVISLVAIAIGVLIIAID